MVQSLTHGNEFSGAIALDYLFREKVKPVRGKLILAFANVAAFARFDFDDPDRSRYIDEDYNRVWADEVIGGSRDSAELRRARELRPFVDAADYLLDLHTMTEPCRPIMVCGMLDKGAEFARRVGVPADLADQRHAALFLATSAVGLFALVLAGTGEAIGVLPGDASLAATLLPAVGAAGLIGLAVVYARLAPAPEPAGGRLPYTLWRLRRFLHDGVRTTVDLLHHGDRFLVFGAITYYAFDVASLGCAFQAFGGGAPPVGIFILAYTLGHAGALVPTPGGIGGTEGGLIGMFVAYGTPLDLAAAAVLGYRVFQLGFPAILGAISLLRIRYVLAHPPPREMVAARFGATRARTAREARD
jgi:hypothetical protein